MNENMASIERVNSAKDAGAIRLTNQAQHDLGLQMRTQPAYPQPGKAAGQKKIKVSATQQATGAGNRPNMGQGKRKDGQPGQEHATAGMGAGGLGIMVVDQGRNLAQT